MLLRVLLFILLSASVQAAEFAVCQTTLPTSNGGTADCTSSGFGTIKGAMVFGGYATANGTAVNHAGLWVGFYDATNQTGLGFASEDNLADSNTGFVRDTNSGLVTLVTPGNTQDGDCQLSTITDGVRFTCADAPPTAYRVNVLLIGGSGVSNVFVGSATGNATQDATTAVSAPGFQPDIVLAVAQTGSTGTSGSNWRASLGMATREGSIVQRALGTSDADAAASMNASSILSTSRLVANGVSGVTLATLELTSFDANGFTVTTRDAATGPAFIYMVIKLNSLSFKLMTSDAPTATGNQAVTGVGFTPQVGIMLQNELTAVDTLGNLDNGETWGLSAFTSAASGFTGAYHEDSDGTSNTESNVGNNVCQARKDNADYAVCTLVSLDSDGATVNYTTTAASATKRAILWVQAAATGGGSMRRRIQ